MVKANIRLAVRGRDVYKPNIINDMRIRKNIEYQLVMSKYIPLYLTTNEEIHRNLYGRIQDDEQIENI